MTLRIASSVVTRVARSRDRRADAADATLLRLFLRDGTSVVSYGEFARLDEQVVFSMPVGGPADQPRLHVVTLPGIRSRLDADRALCGGGALSALRGNARRRRLSALEQRHRARAQRGRVRDRQERGARFGGAGEADARRLAGGALWLPGARCARGRLAAGRGDFRSPGFGRPQRFQPRPRRGTGGDGLRAPARGAGSRRARSTPRSASRG